MSVMSRLDELEQELYEKGVLELNKSNWLTPTAKSWFSNTLKPEDYNGLFNGIKLDIKETDTTVIIKYDKTDENNLDTQVSEKVETFEAKVDKAKQILGGLEKDIAQDKDLKENITDLKNSTQGFLDEHSDEISILKYRLENLINEFLK